MKMKKAARYKLTAFVIDFAFDYPYSLKPVTFSLLRRRRLRTG